MAVPTYRSSPTASRPAAATLTCDAVATEAERRAHFRIRHQVFVIEQDLFGGSYGAAAGCARCQACSGMSLLEERADADGRTFLPLLSHG